MGTASYLAKQFHIHCGIHHWGSSTSSSPVFGRRYSGSINFCALQTLLSSPVVFLESVPYSPTAWSTWCVHWPFNTIQSGSPHPLLGVISVNSMEDRLDLVLTTSAFILSVRTYTLLGRREITKIKGDQSSCAERDRE